MNCTKKITENLFWVGGNDRRIALFENVFPVPKGVSYNAYLLIDEKTVLFDTVDQVICDGLIDNLNYLLADKPLDYIVVNHVEPDHAASLKTVLRYYPQAKIVTNAKAVVILKQFFDFDQEDQFVVVKEGDSLTTGTHTLQFFMAPMVHWPETMVTYDCFNKVLFSADAFGTFGALSGNIFADEMDFDKDFMDEARRYYTNIVGKYGPQVQALLKKAASLDIQFICPLHGPIWRKDIAKFIEKYQRWSTWEAECNSALIIYGSVYGNTENAAEILACDLADQGVKNIAVYDVSKTHFSYLVAECFKYSHIIFAGATYNGGIFCNMETLLHHLKAHMLQNKTVALIENGSWGATANKQMIDLLSTMKNIRLVEEKISIKSSLNQDQHIKLHQLAQQLAKDILK